ncbi:hypothetical protein PFISCL1PPCAC_940, partial [Pristionchus fissidentatus]
FSHTETVDCSFQCLEMHHKASTKSKSKSSHSTSSRNKKGKPAKLGPGAYVKLLQNSHTTNTYKVLRPLNGEFGEIYAVHPFNSEDKEYVLKSALRVKHVLVKLENEMNVYLEIEKAAADISKSRFLKMIDKGKTTHYFFLILETIALSIADIRRLRIVDHFSLATVAHIARETLKALESLHKIGYLHRNLTPRNFYVGFPPRESKIYLADFGLARKFQTDEKKCRLRVGFEGTVRYGSRAAHEEKEQGRKDDLESWFYAIIEIYNKDTLIWRRIPDKIDVYRLKNQLMTKPNESRITKLLPAPLSDIIMDIHLTSFGATPDYKSIHRAITFLEQMDKRPSELRTVDWKGRIPNPKGGIAKHDQDEVTGKKRRENESKKRSNAEEKLAKLYKELGQGLSHEEIKEAIRERVERKRLETTRKSMKKKNGRVRTPEKEEKEIIEITNEKEEKVLVKDVTTEKIRLKSKTGSTEEVKETVKEKIKDQSKDEKVDEKKEKMKKLPVYGGLDEYEDDEDDKEKTPTQSPRSVPKVEEPAKTPPQPMVIPKKEEKKEEEKKKEEKKEVAPDEEKRKKLAQMLDDYIVLEDVNEMERQEKEKEAKTSEMKTLETTTTSQMSPVSMVQPTQLQQLQQPEQSQMSPVSQLQQTQLLPPSDKDGEEDKKPDDKKQPGDGKE